MPTIHRPRYGSLQYWPRKRAAKILPSVNWRPLENSSKHKGLLGYICYKAGMARILVKDLTNDSLTKGKKIVVPITILECPPIKILSVRFYKNGKVVFESLNKNLDKNLKRKIRLPKKQTLSLEEAEKKLNEADNIRVIVYSLADKIDLKKTPDVIEMGIAGNLNEKIDFVKNNIEKEISIINLFSKNQMIDIKGLTRGFGFQGPIRRFGMGLRGHKAEKGQRRPGTLGAWTPSRVLFSVPQAGQMGFFKRLKYNNKIIEVLSPDKFPFSIENYGKLSGNLIILKGSIQGTPKRQLIISPSVREKKKTSKENFEIIKFMK